jgi:membrane fusion protein (multidrug efflux system)
VAVLALAALVVLRIWAAQRNTDVRRSNVTLVRTDYPTRDTVIQSIRLSGDVLPIQQAQIFSKVTGTLERVYAELGDKVQQGQRLALVDTTELAQQCQQTYATLYNTRQKYIRTQELVAQNLSAKQDLDQLQADLGVDSAAYETAKIRLSYASITAPFGGYVTRRYLDPGAVLTATSATILTLMDLSDVKIIVPVLEKDVPLVHTGMKADITIDALDGSRFTGTVTRLGQALDLGTRTMSVEIDIPNPDLVLKPGMYATVSLVTHEHPDALTVPTQALLHDDKGTFLYLAAGQTAHRRDVVTGGEKDSRTEIISGLADADTILIAGQQLVRDGGTISIKN